MISEIPVRMVIETAKKVLYTGHIGNGKIFVYDVEKIVKVRTGEEGYRELFEKHYPGQAQMIAGFWMPNSEWEGCNVNDPSARVLGNYGDSGK